MDPEKEQAIANCVRSDATSDALGNLGEESSRGLKLDSFSNAEEDEPL